MQVKKSQKIFEFFDFFEGVQRIFFAQGGWSGASEFLFAKFGGREKARTKMRHGNFRAVNPNASQGMSNYTLRGVFLTM